MQTVFEVGVDGRIEISIIIPNADTEISVMEMQAIACEHVADAVAHRAASFRRLLTKNPS